jgi:predicted membrane protein
LLAYYGYTDSDLSTDSSVVIWYDWATGKRVQIATGATLSSTFVTAGRILSFTVLPYNGVTYGDLVESNVVLVI